MDKAELIIRVAGHLRGWLPGEDHKAAISHLRSSCMSWAGRGYGYGGVTKNGIGDWETLDAAFRKDREEARLFVTWTEMLKVIEAGCAAGHLEAFEKAQAEWRAAVDASRRGLPGPDPWAVEQDLYAARDALIRHGVAACEPLVLF